MKKDQKLRCAHPHLEGKKERLNADPSTLSPSHNTKVSTMPLSLSMSCETLFLGPYEFVLYDFFFFEIKIRTRIWMHDGSVEPWDMRGVVRRQWGCWSGAEEAGLYWRLTGQLLAQRQ